MLRTLRRTVTNRLRNQLFESVSWRKRIFRNVSMTLEDVSEQSTVPVELDDWRLLDGMYTGAHRRLQQIPAWRYGTRFAHDGGRFVFEGLNDQAPIVDASYCELGCGDTQPYAISTVMYLNGANSCLATDITAISQPRRAAEALYELALDCLINPAKWLWSSQSEEEFLLRVRRFDFQALAQGDLLGGVKNLPLQHHVADINAGSLPKEAFTIMSSRAVLEHFMDFDAAITTMFETMQPGGLGYHTVDMVDHRGYGPRPDYHYWSFLEQDEWDGNTNRLRSAEILQRLQNVGFEIVDMKPERDTLPEGLRGRLKGKFRDMSDEELEIIRMNILIRRPEAA